MAANFEKGFAGAEEAPMVWPWRVFVFSLVLFLVSTVSYLGLRFGYGSFLNSQIAKKDQEIMALAQAVPVAEQEALIKFYSQLANLQEVLNNHVFASKLLPLLEKYTNKRVYYNGMSFNVEAREVSLDSIADSYEILAQQLEAFRQVPEIESLTINNSALRENKVSFQLVLTLKEGVLK